MKKKKIKSFLNQISYIAKNIWNFLSIKDRKKIYYLALIIHISSFLQIFSIASAIPMIGILLDPNFNEGFFYIWHEKYFPGNSFFHFIIFIFCLLTLIAGLSKIFIQREIIMISHMLGSKLSVKIFRYIFEENYQNVYQQNSSEYVASIMLRSNAMLNSGISALLNIFNSVTLTIIMFLFLVFYNFIFSFFFLITILILYYLILRYGQTNIYKNGFIVAKNYSKLIKFIQETYGLFRDIVINRMRNNFILNFKTLSDDLREAQGKNVFYATFPVMAIETALLLTVGISLIILNKITTNPLQVIAIFAISGLKLLPYINNIIRSSTAALADYNNIYLVFKMFKNKKKFKKPLLKNISKTNSVNFEYLKLSNISFKFNKSEVNLIQNLNLKVNKNDKIAIYGESGAGKSTLLDLMTGILLPTFGEIKSNNKINSLSKQHLELFSYVPQKYFIFNDSIKNNIILYKKYNENLFNEALKISMLESQIAKFKKGANHPIGDGGLALSGGQKQRLVIARALYSNKEIIILDEATSGLDPKTELRIINNLIKLKNKTIILVSHNKNIVKKFNKIYILNNKKLCLKK